MQPVETARTLVRPLSVDDLDALVAYRRRSEVARYQDWDDGYSMDQARQLLAGQSGLALGVPGTWFQLVVVDRASGAPVGDIGWHTVGDQPRTAEFGVTFDPAHQGRGLATEALGAMVGHGFGALGLHRVLARCDDRNRRVQALFGRLGLRLEARFVEADWFKGEWTTLRVYAVLAREWAARAAAP